VLHRPSRTSWAVHPESRPGNSPRTKIRRRLKETVAAGAQENSRIGACVLCLLATISRGTENGPGHRLEVWGGGGVDPGARLKRYYVCLCATYHPPLTLTTHKMRRPLLRTDACRLAVAVPFPPPTPRSIAGQAATARHGRAAAPWVYIKGVWGWRSVDTQRSHGQHDMHLQQV